MNIFKRVWTNIKRYKGRTLMLLLAVFLVGVLMAGATLVNQAVDISIGQLQRSMPLVFSAVYDENFENGSESPTLFSREMVHEIGNLPYVSHFDYTMLYQLPGYYLPHWLEELDRGSPDERPYYTFRVHGVSQPEVIYIESGMYDLYAGRLFTMEEVQPTSLPEIAPALVSKEFAELNQLSIGSIVQLMDFNLFYLPENAQVPEGGFTGMYWGEELWEHPYNQSQDIIYEFEIVGLFEFTRIIRGSSADLLDHQSMINLFFTPNWRVGEIMQNHVNAWQQWADVFNMHDWEDGLVELIQTHADAITPLWVLDNVEDIERFKEAANQILPPHFTIDDGLAETFRPMIEATHHLNGTVGQVLWLSSGAMVIVLTLLILLYLRERKHELGIYLALGERKIKLVFQVLLEVFVVSVVGLFLALLIANTLSESISLSLIQTELAAQARSDLEWPSTLEMIGFGQELTPDEMLAYFDVSLNIRSMFSFLAVGVGTVFIATVVPVIYILELNPKEILMKAKIE